MTYMLQEIHEQPEILERLAASEWENVKALAKTMKEKGIEQISITARGTSDNAATYAKYLLEINNGIPVSLAAPSVFTMYHSKVNLSKWLVIGISQSGESTDITEVMKQVKGMGALTLGLTNVKDSTLAKISDFSLFCDAGDEKSVAATKTYTSTLGLIYLLSAALKGDDKMPAKLNDAAAAIRKIFAEEQKIADVVARYRYMIECMVVARGLNQCTCQEAALKLAETCYIVAKAYSAADVQHGPIAAVFEGFPVFVYAPAGKAYSSMVELATKMKENGAELIVISSEDEILGMATTAIKVPAVDEEISPIVDIVAGQLFAQYLALSKGNNPDQPRHLKKVTLTM
jgi:glucosamine--fructose-6-phosphate aminotransferase (isomerizing)